MASSAAPAASTPSALTICIMTPTKSRASVLHYGDLTDGSSLRSVISQIQPDEIYNLGAQSHVRVSFDQPAYTVEADALGTLILLEAIRDSCPKARYYQAGSSEMFGKARETPRRRQRPSIPAAPTDVLRSFPIGRPSTTGKPTNCSPATASCSITSHRVAARRS